MDRFQNVESFVRVVEAGSISGAAERFDVAKSAVSRRLRELEKHLGVELFHRSTRQLKLTESGQEFYRHALQLLENWREAEASIAQSHSALEGRIKLSLPLNFGLMHMGSAINEFLSLHPGIHFDLDFNDRTVDLLNEGLDLAIRIAELPDSTLIATPLSCVRHMVCASPDYIAKHGTPEQPADLQRHRCLHYNLSQHRNQWLFSTADGEVMSVQLTPYQRANNGDYLRDAAISGLGIVQLPTFVVHEDIAQGRLCALLADYQRPPLQVYALRPHSRHLSQRVRVFVDFLRQRFAQEPYWDHCLR